MATVTEVVCGATGQDLVVPIVDEYGAPINITGGAVKLQGTSADIVKTLDVSGAILDGANGKAVWVGIGNESTYVSQSSDLVSLPSATYTLRVKLTLAGEVFYSPTFQVRWVRKPI